MAAQELSPLDHKVLKLVGEAEKGLAGLGKDIGQVISKLDKGKVEKAKLMAASKKLTAFMGKFTSVTKIQTSKIYDQLAPQSQKRVDWMDHMMGLMLGWLGKLNAAKSFAGKDPKKNYTLLIKTDKTYLGKYPSTPKGVGTLVKQIEKAGNADGPQGAMLGILPMAIILWMILDTIIRGFKKKP